MTNQDIDERRPALLDWNSRIQSDSAVFYTLARGGFFAEFNVLCSAIADCLASDRHIFLTDESADVRWIDLFQVRLPRPVEADLSRYNSVQPLFRKTDRDAWNAMRERVRAASLRGDRVNKPGLAFSGTMTDLVFFAANEMFRPTPELLDRAADELHRLGLDHRPFVAVHVRRGDKVHGMPKKDGRLKVESQAIPFSIYRERLRAFQLGLRDVLVLTDDYAVVEEARESNPDLQIHSLCRTDERGYFQHTHRGRPYDERRRAVQRLIVEVLLAKKSTAFVGAYVSNVSSFIHMVHPRREMCASVDERRVWIPV